MAQAPGGEQIKAAVQARQSLLSWYGAHRRDLPWRADRDPYHVWISEIMLQQTRVEAARGYYERFIGRLPRIGDLAAAPEDELMKLWQGLGYYSRARNLQRAARAVVQEHGGQMPRTAAALRTLPGIGPYTAAAIASIAFDEPEPAVDGNLLRIYARLTACGENSRSEVVRQRAHAYFLQLMTAEEPPETVREEMAEEQSESAGRRPGDVNQALMDLGAGVCLPKGAPLCDTCPLAEDCAAYAAGTKTEYPVMPAKKPRRIEDRTVFVIRDAGRVILRRRPERGLLAGLYEFPNTEGRLDRASAESYVRGLGIEPIRIRALAPAKHVFTHIEWHMTGYEVIADEFAPPPGEPLIPAGIAEIRGKYPIPSAFASFLKGSIPEGNPGPHD